MPHRTPSVAGLVLGMAAFLLLGGSVTYFMWHELSTLLYGRVDEVHFAVLAGSIVGFLVLLKLLGVFVRWVGGPGWTERKA